MSGAVYLHIGAPKTGTTYVQDRLTRNVENLAEHDVHFPGRHRWARADRFHFQAALDLLDQDWGGPPGHARGAWDQMVQQVRRHDGTTIISHEILAPAREEAVERALADLGGRELHLVYSARDLARQMPAAWQESIRQGRHWHYRGFLNRAQQRKVWFAKAFDLPTVLSRWAATVPPENVHLVTVPQAGQNPSGDVLWQRFCQAFAIDPAWAPVEARRTNASLDAVETQVLRLLNQRMGRRTRREASFDDLVRQVLARGQFTRAEGPPVRLPPQRYDWAEEEAGRWIEWARQSGINVIGDLEELRPVRPGPDEPFQHPDQIPRRDVLDVAIDALAAMTHEAARRRVPEQQPAARAKRLARRIRRR